MSTPDPIDTHSSTPLYLQLKDKLFKRISSGELKPNQRLPSEREMVEELGISRMTVRNALQALVREGFLYTRIGKGTFVSNINFQQDNNLTGFTEQMGKLDLEVSSQVLEFSVAPIGTKLSTSLEVSPNSAVYKLCRIRLANQKPLAVETAYIPKDLCPNLDQFDFSSLSLYETMRREYGIRMATAEQTIVASLAKRDEHRLFNTKPPAAVLRMKRVTRTDRDLIAEYVESVYLGESYEVRTLLTC